MEYTLEHFELDMRKVDLYAENAVAAFNIAVDEASLYSEGTEYDLIITEASDGLGAKIKAAFDKILESIKKFFSSLIEKIKSIFTKDSENKAKKIIASNPDLGKEKIEIVDIKSIQEYCGKRKILCNKLIKKFESGTLTQDEFDKTVEEMDTIKKRLKTVGKVAATIAAALAVIGGGVAILSNVKKEGNDTIVVHSKIKKKYDDAVALKVAQLNASVSTENAQEMTAAKTSIWKKIWTAIRHPVNSAIDRKATKAAKNEFMIQKGAQLATRLEKNALRRGGVHAIVSADAFDDDGSSASPMSLTSSLKMDAEDYNNESADLFDYDLDDTFFDI